MDELNQPSSPIQNNIPPTPPPLRPSGFSGQAPPQTNIVPPPPADAGVQVRTMESDMRSASGGAEPAPQFVTPPPVTNQPPLRPAGSAGQAPSIPPSTPVTPPPAPMPAVTEVKPSRLILSLGALAVIVGIGWISYAYLLPWYRGMTVAPEPTVTEELPPPKAPPTAEPTASSAQAPATTLLGGTRSTLPNIDTDGSLASITAALAAEAEKKSVTGTVEEIAITNAGIPINLDAYMGALLPEAATNGLAGILTAGFDQNFSAYLYYDDRGAWPGYVAKINPASQIDAVTLMSRLQALETSSYKNLFLDDPGAGDAWKTGQARGKYIDRFIPLETQGALFNYGIFGDYLIINTSNNGLVKALDLLKL